MAETVRGKVKPVQAIAKPPMIYNIVYQYTKRPPLLPIVEESRQLERNPKVLAVSVSGGLPVCRCAAGGAERGGGDGQRSRRWREREAQRLSDMLWATREQLKLHLPEAAEAVQAAPWRRRSSPWRSSIWATTSAAARRATAPSLLAELLRQKAARAGWW